MFCVISRYHGGAFVVFSQRLNEGFETIAVEGALRLGHRRRAAAAVVFTREVDRRDRTDAADRGARGAHRATAEGAERAAPARRAGDTAGDGALARRWASWRPKFDSIHSIQRAVEVGSVERIVKPRDLRPYLIDAVERGMRRTLDRLSAGNGRAVGSRALLGERV